MSVRDVVMAAAGAGGDKLYIEDVFSTYLYTGNSSTQTITNGIDLAGEGGMVWIKSRSSSLEHALFDTARGATKYLSSNNASEEITDTNTLTGFNSNGFSLGNGNNVNSTSFTPYVSWSFRKAPKFFDVVQYTGTGAGLAVNHNLGTVPGCMIVKCSSGASISWFVWHRGLSSATQSQLTLNSTNAESQNTTVWNNTAPTSTQFFVNGSNRTSENGATYVAYLFAHDAGGFGDDGEQNVISCGSYTGNGSATGPVVTLGWEPQWLLFKRSNSTGDWNLIDNMRGFTVGGTDAELNPNLSDAETTGTFVTPTATGFQLNTTDAGYNASGGTYIYIAIRRGPMKTPESGTEVFQSYLWTGNNAANRILTGISFPPDFANLLNRTTLVTANSGFYDRLRGAPILVTSGSNATQSESYWAGTGVNMGAFGQSTLTLPSTTANWNANSVNYVAEFFRRAPGFFDVVCYTGDEVAGRTVNHNLNVIPELMIVKRRNSTGAWQVYAGSGTEYLVLNTTAAKVTGNSNRWNSTLPTSSVFSLGTDATVNGNGSTYVAYLFASLPGVSKIGTYTGTGTASVNQIDCGFTNGARYVLVKRTDSTGDWYVWDTARGIVSGNDPYLLLNSTAAEVTNTDWIDPLSSGFELSNVSGNNANISGASYIFLAIA